MKTLINFHIDHETLKRVDDLAMVMAKVKNRRVPRAELINRGISELLDVLEPQYRDLEENTESLPDEEQGPSSETWMGKFKAEVAVMEEKQQAEIREANFPAGRVVSIRIRIQEIFAVLAELGNPPFGFKDMTARYLKSQGYQRMVTTWQGKAERAWVKKIITKEKQ